MSRTEILRKTCPVWKAIAEKFGQLAATFSGTQGNHRKTEFRREKSARALLAGEGDLLKLFHSEEVITLLPGKQHVTLEHFLRKCRYDKHAVEVGVFTVARYPRNVPKGEILARAGITTVVHPVTLTRFGCFELEEFMECLARMQGNLTTYHEQLTPDERGYWSGDWRASLSLIDFATLSEAYVERTRMVSEKTLDAKPAVHRRRCGGVWPIMRRWHQFQHFTGGSRRQPMPGPMGKRISRITLISCAG
ncbi:hypothetical protein [Enterobacter sp. CP102]|uniref:hypothetical protein n=1 Tax=Enterobacter sp. CP102 TaxID=2976431 RepID=UPI0038FD2897